jgi:hypothetical protein
MTEMVNVIYRGPSGCLIDRDSGVEFHKDQLTRAPLELVERLRKYESQHILEDGPDEEKATGGLVDAEAIAEIGEESPLIQPSLKSADSATTE